MKILDANIFIYAAQFAFAHLRPLLIDPECVVSDITRLEVLGFPRLPLLDKAYFERVFRRMARVTVTSDIIDQAILLRQVQKMSLGDSIIASTALIHGYELQTRNMQDFVHIKGLICKNLVDTKP